MKKYLIAIVAVIAFFGLITKPVVAKSADTCKYIKDGTIIDKFDAPITLGYNKWGYNYQAHMFNGMYCDAYGGAGWCQQFKDVSLMMKWNDAWLSNKDCGTQGADQLAYSNTIVPDNKLDRHYPTGTYIGSDAWLTNHATGTYPSTKTWNVVGDWVLSFNYLGSLYVHDMTVVDVVDNTFTGIGGYPSSSDPYAITWTVSGTVVGDTVTMHIAYNGSSYYVNATGTITPGGTMSGTWGNGSQSGIWSSTSGSATRPICTVSDFVKIVAVPADAKSTVDNIKCPDNLYDGNRLWKTADGEEIGCSIWGSFAIIQEIASDPCGEYGVINYLSPLKKGLGNWSK